MDTSKTPPNGVQIKLLPLLEKLKDAYLLWFQYYQILPKSHRFSIGQRIDAILIAAIEAVTTASFLPQKEKLPFVAHARRKIDTAKVLLLVLWETKSIDSAKYIALSEKFTSIGKMLGGWSGQIEKQNSPNNPSEEK